MSSGDDVKVGAMTPGPWGVDITRLTKTTRITGSMPGAENVLEIAILTNLRGGMTEANAKAIAALPELIEACEMMLSEIRAYQGEEENEEGSPVKLWCDTLKTALKKAGVL